MTRNQALKCSTQRTAYKSCNAPLEPLRPPTGRRRRPRRRRRHQRPRLPHYNRVCRSPRYYRKPSQVPLSDQSTDHSQEVQRNMNGVKDEGAENSIACRSSRNMRVEVKGRIVLDNVKEASARRFFASATSLKAPEAHVLSAPRFL